MWVFENSTCILRTYKPLSRNHFCRAKGQNNTSSERVSLALVIQHAMCVSRITLSSVVCIPLPHFPTLSHNGTIIREWGKLLNTKCITQYHTPTNTLVYDIFKISLKSFTLKHSYCSDMFRQRIACHPQGALVILSDSSRCTVQR